MILQCFLSVFLQSFSQSVSTPERHHDHPATTPPTSYCCSVPDIRPKVEKEIRSHCWSYRTLPINTSEKCINEFVVSLNSTWRCGVFLPEPDTTGEPPLAKYFVLQNHYQAACPATFKYTHKRGTFSKKCIELASDCCNYLFPGVQFSFFQLSGLRMGESVGGEWSR